MLFSSGSDQPFPSSCAGLARAAFTIAVTFAAGILFGLAPALRGSRIDLTPSLKQTASSASRRCCAQRALVPSRETRWSSRKSRSLLLCSSARDCSSARCAIFTVLNPGFDTRNVLLFGHRSHARRIHRPETQQLYSDLQQRFAALPGVISVSYSEDALLSGNWSGDDVHLDGAPPKQNVEAARLAVGLNFFSTMRIPLFAGRTFNSADFAVGSAINAARTAAEEAASKAKASNSANPAAAATRAVSKPNLAPVPVIINETFARQYFRESESAGQTFQRPAGRQRGACRPATRLHHRGHCRRHEV